MKHRTRMLWCVILLFPLIGQGQVKFGVDLYSRYLWRGLDYGNSPSLQPVLTYTVGGFTLGTWGAYSFGASSTDSAGIATVFAEHDLTASYSVPTSAGSISLLYTDYFYPSSGLKYFNFNGNGGAHVLEAGAGFTGPEQFPAAFTVFYNFHNDPDHSMYLQFAFPVRAGEATVSFSGAFTPAKSVWYGTTNAGMVSAAVTVTRTLNVTETFAVPFTVSYQLNPYAERSYLLAGITL